jgi:hypothetical protein
MESLRNELVAIYKELNIPDEVPENIIYAYEPIEPIYDNIYEAIAKDPIKYRYILDRIIETKFIEVVHQDTRNKLSLLYPDDEELTYKLLIDTATYYKIKCYPNERGSWDDEDCDKEYKLITHCTPIYFTHYFSNYCKSNPNLIKFLESRNIKCVHDGSYNINTELYAFYESRK